MKRLAKAVGPAMRTTTTKHRRLGLDVTEKVAGVGSTIGVPGLQKNQEEINSLFVTFVNRQLCK